MKLLALICISCFIFEATSQLYNLTTSHQAILEKIFPQPTDFEKRLVSELPEDFISRFPIPLDGENSKDIHPDILWRLPRSYFQLSGSDLGHLVRETSHDLTIIWKAVTLLRKASESDRFDFLNLLPKLPTYSWEIIGEFKPFVAITKKGECLHWISVAFGILTQQLLIF